MKQFLMIFTLLSVCATGMKAKTIYWLTFIDTTDPNVGAIDINIKERLYSRWIEPVNAVLKENGYTIDTSNNIYGYNVTPENCRSIVQGLTCSTEDIVVFYYVGHGTENTGTSKYPLMWMAQSNANKLIPLSWVHDKLKSKGARLTVSIGMCCNAAQNIPGRNSPTFDVNYGNTYVDEEMASCIKKLFLNYSGDIVVTSSSPGESSRAFNDPSLGPMDIFSYCLIDQFCNVQPSNWDDMLSDLRNNSNYISTTLYGETQTAIWTANLSSASTPSKTGVVKPTTTTTSSSTKDKIIASLNSRLAYITDNNASDKIEVAEETETMFASGCIVRIISQDGNVVVDKEDYSTFIGRISTSRILMNVSVVDLEVNDFGKITSLRVREVYKK